MFVSSAALADSTGERRPGDRAPTATDVISGLYAFSRFQQGLLEGTDLGEIAITSHAMVSTHSAPADAFRLAEFPGVAAVFHHAEGDKCARCWMILPEVGHNATYPDLCNRCIDVVQSLDGSAG